MLKHRIANTAGIVAATLLCWLYGLHLYHSANQPLYRSASQPLYSPPPQPAAHAPPSAPAPAPMRDSSDSILTFIHASDVHISKFVPKGGLVHFLHFMQTSVPLISPRALIVTGDLTDGKDKHRLISQQQPEEWLKYAEVLERHKLRARFNGTFYRDQRGNHDCFNVFSADSKENYFKQYSAARDSSGYLLQIQESFGLYSFVATDGCPAHGFARPLNFFGYLDAPSMQLLEQRMDAAKDSNHTFLLNHYPVSTMLYGRHSRPFKALVERASVFLCGHLHELVGGIGRQLQAYKASEGYWELEIGDMKEHAVYRVFAVDHDLVSFVDVRLPLSTIPLSNPALLDARVEEALPHPPVILVTNPKDARYLLPKHEPLERMRTSSFIRMLVWTDAPVSSITVAIDGHRLPHPAAYRGRERQVVEGRADETVKVPLWVVPWDPAQYDDARVHQLQVTVVDEMGKQSTSLTPFALGRDVSIPLNNDARGGWIMQQDFASMFRISGFISYIIMALCLLVIPRLYYAALPNYASWLSDRAVLHHKQQALTHHLFALLQRDANIFARSKLLLAILAAKARFVVWTQFTAQVHFSSSWLFWPSYLFAMSICVLPLFAGRLIPSAAGSDGIGSVYAYGIYMAGEWSPLLDSWTYALASIVSLAVLLVYLPAAIAPPHMFYSPRALTKRPWYRSVAIRVAMLVFIFVYLGIPVLMTLYTYGWESVVFGYGKAWLFIASSVALYMVDWRLPVSLSSYEVPAAST
ncbi:hypothetical protein LPJ55_003762 [Coemansia sp. RSA 990]|nr:Metallo-dependent phosphatase-like protein [Coemansia mojavensis]KAJ1871580.1 hypothetical protein LPJ55_003762 [Coemansia sp. RSA 990]